VRRKLEYDVESCCYCIGLLCKSSMKLRSQLYDGSLLLDVSCSLSLSETYFRDLVINYVLNIFGMKILLLILFSFCLLDCFFSLIFLASGFLCLSLVYLVVMNGKCLICLKSFPGLPILLPCLFIHSEPMTES